MYNPKSLKAEEFISHEEILDTLDYAEKNKDNLELVDKIIEKAAERKGLDHREASVLLDLGKFPAAVVRTVNVFIIKNLYGKSFVLTEVLDYRQSDVGLKRHKASALIGKGDYIV